jgi:hypothetical protein
MSDSTEQPAGRSPSSEQVRKYFGRQLVEPRSGSRDDEAAGTRAEMFPRCPT